MNIGVAIGMGGFIALVVAIVICAILLPRAKEGQFTGFAKFLRDYFLLKYLMVEAILRFFFVLNTCSCIFVGFFLLFAKTESFWGRGQSTAVYGILLIVFGPIGTRILYELTMIAIMQLKNTMEINAKIKGDAGAATNLFGMPKTSHDFVSNIANSVRQAAAPVQSQPQQMYNNAAPAQPQQMYNTPVAQPAPAPQQSAPAPEVPVAQETPAEITCPNCGATVVADATFCDKCGTKLK